MKLSLVLFWASSASWAQGTSVDLLGSSYDNSLPVEVTADKLAVDQASSAATFEGNARVGQGDMRLEADSIRVEYLAEGGVSKVEAIGNVTFTNGAESAEAQSAVYLVGEARITMSGGVLLIQGPNAISGDRLLLDLTTNQGVVEGNVKTVFTPKPQE
jgi:lipopolysaccharide export system protein LptA